MSKYFLYLIVCFSCLSVYSQNNRINYDGRKLFLTGNNIPWINKSQDLGPGMTDTASFKKVFMAAHKKGLNTLRFWLHINGLYTPQFQGVKVVGPGTDALSNLKAICDLANKNGLGLILCLWSTDMLDNNNGTVALNRNKGILTVDSLMNSYIDNSLVPMVHSLQGNPGIVAWEIFNEPEGMCKDVQYGAWPGLDLISITNVQRFINKCAAAIHKTDTNALVTNGAWCYISATDVDGYKNDYTDSRLIAAGGDSAGILDFYTLHYYDWAANPSPFNYSCSYFKWDKPMVITEFNTNCNYCNLGNNFENLYNNGYAGALCWSGGENDVQQLMYKYVADSSLRISGMTPYAPYLDLISPLNNDHYKLTDTIKFRAEATDLNGSITKVEFFEGENKIAEKLSSPYQFDWINATGGIYKVYAKAINSSNDTTISKTVYVQVGNPPIYTIQAEDATINGNTNITRCADASEGMIASFTNSSATSSMEWMIPNCPKDSIYEIKFTYRLSADIYKEQDLYINNQRIRSIPFSGTDRTTWFTNSTKVSLHKGENKLKLVSTWGWMDFDFMEIPFEVIPVTQIKLQSSSTFIDKNREKLRITPVFTPANTTDTLVSWKVDTNSIASIDSSGVITPKANGTVKIIAIANTGYWHLVSDTLKISITNQGTNLSEVEYSHFKIFPNPCSDEIIVSADEIIKELRISNLLGQCIKDIKCNSTQAKIVTNDLNNGFYLITVFTNKSTFTQQIIKTKY